MLLISFPEVFLTVVEEAKHRTGGAAQWIVAIDKAAEAITDHPERLEWMTDRMLIFSPHSDEVYEANGQCGCTAFEFHRPCWHRAAARLWGLYLEAINEYEWRESLKDMHAGAQVSV